MSFKEFFFLPLLCLLVFFIFSNLQASFSQENEDPNKKFVSPTSPNLNENSVAFASGCYMERSPYSNGGAFTDGEKFILVWQTEHEAFLYSLKENHLTIPSHVSFNGPNRKIPFSFESLGGMWSGLFFQDVFHFLNNSNFQIIYENNLKTLSEIAGLKSCEIKYENLEGYIEWMHKQGDKK